MSESVNNNKRIAKNTFLLYIRTFFVMIISIYTSRVILQALGVEDYGVYNVVGGIVSMLAIVSNSVTAAISRFITYEIGSGNKERLHQVVATSKVVLYVLAGLVLVVTEIIGVWFLRTQMQIPDGREDAAMYVLQCSIVSFCVSLVAIPYNACVIAHEHMNAYAYISISLALLKLGICYILVISPTDKLVTYAILMMLSEVLFRGIYSFYCHHYFEESKERVHFYKPVFREMFGFAGWSFFTSANSVLSTQGVNMLINVFYGVTFNAARGVANQVQSAMSQFVSSFVSAINPQITKSYAAGEIDDMYTLVCRGARFSYYLTLVMFVPLFFEAETILHIWLTIVPEKAVLFTRLSLIYILMDGAGYTLYTANLATGRIKKYSLVLSSITFFIFPVTWIVYYCGGKVETAYYVAIASNFIYHVARMFLTQDNVGLRVKTFFKSVYVPIALTTVFAVIPSFLICWTMQSSFLRLCISLFVGVGTSAISSLLIGMSSHERAIILNKVKSVLSGLIRNT